ncbi:hypothetical protein ISCGN_003570 [Ixodes scapularis]
MLISFSSVNIQSAFALVVDVTSLFQVSWECKKRNIAPQLRGKLQRCRGGPRVLTVEQQVLAALRFYAAGGFQGTAGSDENIGVLQCSVSRVLGDVTNAIIDCLGSKWLCFQQTQAE